MIAKFRVLIFLAALVLPLGLPALAHAQAATPAPVRSSPEATRPKETPERSTATSRRSRRSDGTSTRGCSGSVQGAKKSASRPVTSCPASTSSGTSTLPT